MAKEQKIIVFGRTKQVFEIKDGSYQVQVTGLGYQIATELAQKHQVCLYTQLAEDFLGEQIVHQLNSDNIELINSFSIDKTECQFLIDNQPVQMSKQTFEINFTNQQYDWVIVTDVFKNLDDFSELLHEAKSQNSKVAYFLEQLDDFSRIDSLLEDVGLVILNQQKLFEITKTDILNQALDRFSVKTDNFLVISEQQLIGRDQNSSYKTDNFEIFSELKIKFLSNYIENRDFIKAMTKIIPNNIKIRESGHK